MTVQDKNKRIPQLDSPGDYPYVEAWQFRDGSWERQDTTPNNSSRGHGHIKGSFHETSSDGSQHNLTVNSHHIYVQAGSTTTTEASHHEKIGSSKASQIQGDTHTENAGGKFNAIANNTIHASGGTHFFHATKGIQRSSAESYVTDHNDDASHHQNIGRDRIVFIGGTDYKQIGSEHGVYCPNGNMDYLISGNVKIQSQGGQITYIAPTSITLQCGKSSIVLTPSKITITSPEVDFVKAT